MSLNPLQSSKMRQFSNIPPWFCECGALETEPQKLTSSPLQAKSGSGESKISGPHASQRPPL